MGLLLAIDTSTQYAAVALAEGRRWWQQAWFSRNNHGRELVPAIRGLLEQAGRDVADVRCIAVAIGPGGFSALRVGIATAKGLAMARGIGLVGVSTFDIEAARRRPVLAPLYAVIDAGSAGVAWARYAPRVPSLEGPTRRGLSLPEALAEMAEPGSLFCGEGVFRLSGLVPESRLLTRARPSRRPQDLIRLASERIAAGRVVAPGRVAPDYARAPSITHCAPPARLRNTAPRLPG